MLNKRMSERTIEYIVHMRAAGKALTTNEASAAGRQASKQQYGTHTYNNK